MVKKNTKTVLIVLGVIAIIIIIGLILGAVTNTVLPGTLDLKCASGGPGELSCVDTNQASSRFLKENDTIQVGIASINSLSYKAWDSFEPAMQQKPQYQEFLSNHPFVCRDSRSLYYKAPQYTSDIPAITEEDQERYSSLDPALSFRFCDQEIFPDKSILLNTDVLVKKNFQNQEIIIMGTVVTDDFGDFGEYTAYGVCNFSKIVTCTIDNSEFDIPNVEPEVKKQFRLVINSITVDLMNEAPDRNTIIILDEDKIEEVEAILDETTPGEVVEDIIEDIDDEIVEDITETIEDIPAITDEINIQEEVKTISSFFSRVFESIRNFFSNLF